LEWGAEAVFLVLDLCFVVERVRVTSDRAGKKGLCFNLFRKDNRNSVSEDQYVFRTATAAARTAANQEEGATTRLNFTQEHGAYLQKNIPHFSLVAHTLPPHSNAASSHPPQKHF
jgi:hypothetical protein